ncbi:MAG: class I SAM-dependent methyltransferase, partial [Planctomycetes bacterium]|nr:class I SAM-dependent methyltransferase [Planctomycetota bacterium]
MSMSKPRRDFTLRLVLALWALGTAVQAQEREARAILEAAGVTGGLVVHLGCGDGKLTAALRASDRFLVHGLDTDAAKVEKAREHIRSRGLYGPVSVEAWNGERLPYADNLVNLLVCEYARGRVSESEVMRARQAAARCSSIQNPKSNPPMADQNRQSPGRPRWTSGLTSCTTRAGTPCRATRSWGRRSA